MAKRVSHILLEGTFDNITIYKRGNQYCVRMCHRLDSKRVKTSLCFRRTMEYAGLMSTSSTIASRVYRALPASWKQYWMYKSFVGEAMEMLKNGTSAEAAEKTLWLRYAAEFAEGYKEENEFIRNKEAGSKKARCKDQGTRQKVRTAGLVPCLLSSYVLPSCALYSYSRAG